jgi:hypothetical protein
MRRANETGASVRGGERITIHHCSHLHSDAAKGKGEAGREVGQCISSGELQVCGAVAVPAYRGCATVERLV